MKPTLPVEIINVIVEAEYRGSIYERTVTARIDGKTYDFFEGKSHVTESDIGSVIDLSVLGRPINIQRIKKPPDEQIKQATGNDTNSSKWHSIICGVVNDREHDGRISIDVGFGDILIDIDKNSRKNMADEILKRGKPIEVECSRLDIIGGCELSSE